MSTSTSSSLLLDAIAFVVCGRRHLGVSRLTGRRVSAFVLPAFAAVFLEAGSFLDADDVAKFQYGDGSGGAW